MKDRERSEPVFVGLDYHKSSVQACVVNRPGEVLGNRRCPNDWGQIVKWAGRLGSVARVAIESCTGAADLAEELIAAGWSVDLAHPGYVHRMKQSPDKSDWSDARMLADLTRVGYLPKVWLAPRSIRDLRSLVRYRQQLVNERRSVKLRIRGLLREARVAASVRPWTKPWLAWVRDLKELQQHGRWVMDRHLKHLASLAKEISAVERRLTKVTAGDRMVEKLLSRPGVGLVTACTIRAEIGRFDRFATGKQLARFCGLSPRNASSGERQADAGMIKAGNPQLRTIIMEAAWRLIRHDPRWNALAGDLLMRGKPKSVVVAAIANRWMRWLYHQMRPLGLAA